MTVLIKMLNAVLSTPSVNIAVGVGRYYGIAKYDGTLVAISSCIRIFGGVFALQRGGNTPAKVVQNTVAGAFSIQMIWTLQTATLLTDGG
jgi:hypothetical protein